MTLSILTGTVALITSFIGLLPQIYKTLRTRSAQDLSMLMLINYFLCSLAWILYGQETGSTIVMASNVLGILVCSVLIVLKYNYDKKSSLVITMLSTSNINYEAKPCYPKKDIAPSLPSCKMILKNANNNPVNFSVVHLYSNPKPIFADH